MQRTVFALALTLVAAAALPALGQAGNHFVLVPGVELSGGSLTPFSFGGNGGSRFCDGNPCELMAAAPLPNGSRVLGIEIDACRDTTEDRVINLSLVRRNANESSFVVLAQLQYTATGCTYQEAAASAGPNQLVDTFEDEYLIVATIGSIDCLVTPGVPCPDIGTRVQAVRLYYAPNASGSVEPSKRSAFTLFPP